MSTVESLALHGLAPNPAGGLSSRGAGAAAGDCDGCASGTEQPSDAVTISAEARALGQPGFGEGAVATTETDTDPEGGGPGDEALGDADRRKIEELERRDREVRAHEQAHKAAGGGHAGGIHYEFETGPDGRRYAVGGEVPIDVSPVEGDPAATVRKMEQVRRAALAPADPSGQDRAVAAQASAEAQRARAALADSSPAAEREPSLAGRYGRAPAPAGSALDVVA